MTEPSQPPFGPRDPPAGSTDHRPFPSAAAIGRELFSGASAGLIALPFSVSAGVLAYEPLGREFVGTGAAAGILCSVVGGIVGAIARPSSFVPNATSTSMALIQASFLGGLLVTLRGDVGAALMLLPLTAVLAGLFQVLIAATGLARIVKFTPYPVLAGFVTGLSVLIALQQVPRLFGVLSFGELAAHLAAGNLPAPAMPIFGAALAAAVIATGRYAPRVPAMLAGVAVGAASYHLLRFAAPDLNLGTTVGAVSLDHASFGLRVDPEVLGRVLGDPGNLQSLLLTAVTLAVLGTLDLTFAIRSAHDLHDIDVSPRHNLAGQGLSNVAAALAGGLTVTTSISYSCAIFDAGGRTRLSTIAMALLFLVIALAAPGLIAALPRVVLSAILVTIAFRLWDRWCITLLRDLVRLQDRVAHVRARRNIGIVLAVGIATVLGQPVIGAFVGVVMSCLVFIVEMSRPVVRRRLDGSRLRSKRIRSQTDLAYLRESGRRIAILELQGVLFFGNADDLASEARRLEGEAATLIIDLRRVTDLDTSGVTILRQIAARCRKAGLALTLSGVDASFGSLVTEATGCSREGCATLDDALESAEDQLLAQATSRPSWRALAIGATDLASGLSEAEIASLTARLTRCAYRAGELLCRAGDPADRLWLLTRGSVSVRLSGQLAERRIAGLGPGTSVGEMGLIDRRPRSADVVADVDIEAYVLTAEDFDRLLRETPHLGQSLLATIARLTAQRLRATSEELSLAEV